MAIITIDVPDAKLTQAMESIANQTGWDPAGSTTKAQHAKAHLWTYIKAMVRADLLNTGNDAVTVAVDAEMATW